MIPYYVFSKYLAAALSPSGSGYTVPLMQRNGTTVDVYAPWPTWNPASKTLATPPSSGGTTYYVATSGSDSNPGTAAAPFASVVHGASVLAAGDTLLIHAGLYRGQTQFSVSGTATAPITIGGYGDGEVILDSSATAATSGWALVSGSVYSTNPIIAPNAVNAVVINQIPLSPTTTYAASGVTSGSGTWAFDGSLLTADFGIANTTPASADVIIQTNSTSEYNIYWYEANYLIFNSLTVRGCAGNGMWGYGNYITVQHCNIEFNGKNAIMFEPFSGVVNIGHQVYYNRCYQNSMLNWPRGNNGFNSSMGGWAGTISFNAAYQSIMRGNICYDSGGESLCLYGNTTGILAGSNIAEENLVIDGWSVNIYVDNQPNNIIRRNIAFFSGYDTTTWLYPPSTPNTVAGGNWGILYKVNGGISCGDEYGSSSDGSANNIGTQVYNNLIVGYRTGYGDSAEGALSPPHGMKNYLIANNTFIMPPTTPPGTYNAGFLLMDNGTANYGSLIANNIVIAWDTTTPCMWYENTSGNTGADPGVTIDYNYYSNPGDNITFYEGYNTPVGTYTFAQWQAAMASDQHSVFGVVPLVNGSALNAGTNYLTSADITRFVYTNAFPASGSTLTTGATSMAAYFNTDLLNNPRGVGTNFGIGAIY